MNRGYICDGEEYTYKKGYIALPVRIDGLPPSVEITRVDLQVKTSFHVSLLCVKNLIEKYGEQIEEKIISTFCDFVVKRELNLERYQNEFRFAQRANDDKKTLVVMVDISNINEFFEELRKRLDIEVDVQPTHVTLYTLKLDEGIGINGQEDLKNLTEVVTDQVPEEIKKSL